jgi:hypothetical protein
MIHYNDSLTQHALNKTKTEKLTTTTMTTTSKKETEEEK